MERKPIVSESLQAGMKEIALPVKSKDQGPTLDTLDSVETILRRSDRPLTLKRISALLPRKVEDRMLRAAIEHYKRLGCVTEGSEGVMWTVNTDPAFWSAVETSFRSPGERLSPRGRSRSR